MSLRSTIISLMMNRNPTTIEDWIIQVSNNTGIPVNNLINALDNYQFVDYLQSYGAEWIDTGVKFKEPYLYGTKIKINATSNCAICGSWNSSKNYIGSCLMLYNANKKQIRLDFVYGTTTVFSNILDVNNPIILKVKRNYAKINETEYVASASPLQTQNYNFYIGALNNIGQPYLQFFGNIYYSTITDAGKDTRYFLPCLKGTTPIMLDLMTMTEYTNQGTGTFDTGEVVSLRDKFVEMGVL